MVGFVAVLALGFAACDDNVVKAPKAAESDPQFVVEREMTYEGYKRVIVVRDKINGNLIYITPEAGVFVREDEDE
jgi:hypothetical protein